MQIESFHMPEDINDNPEAQRALSVYAQVRPDIDINDPEERVRLLEDFDDQEVFIARDDDGDIIGVTSYYSPKGKNYLYLSGIAVSRRAQGLGVGTDMIHHLIKIAKEKGKTAIESEPLPTAETFYTRMGATALGGRVRLETD